MSSRRKLGHLLQNGLDWWRGLSEQDAFRYALAIWGIYAVVIAGVVGFDDDIHSVMKIYREATANWWNGEAVYDPRPRNGYFYLPHVAMVLTPYTWFPVKAGEILWRWTLIAALAWSVWQLARVFAGGRPRWFFLVVTVVTAAASLSAVSYGQTNALLAAFFVLAAAALGRAAWNSAALWLVLSLAAKPIGLVGCLLAGACYPRRLVVPLAAGVVLLVGVTFLHPKDNYVPEQYALFAETMQVAQNTKKKHRFCDIEGIVYPFGVAVPDQAMDAVRVAAALVALLLALRAVRSYDTVRGAFLCMLLATVYLMLFNPRTETNSYVMLAPFVGVFAAAAAGRPGSERLFWWLLVFCVVLTVENLGPLHNIAQPWLKPAATLVFAVLLVRDVASGRDPFGLPRPRDEGRGGTESLKSGVA